MLISHSQPRYQSLHASALLLGILLPWVSLPCFLPGSTSLLSVGTSSAYAAVSVSAVPDTSSGLVERLREELDAAQQALSQAVSRNQRYQQEIATLKQNTSTATGNTAAPADTAKRLIEARQGLTKAIDTINQQNARIESLKEKVEQLETANQSYAQLQEKVNSLETQLAKTTGGGGGITPTLGTNNATAVVALKAQLAGAEQDLAQARQTIAQLQQQAAEANQSAGDTTEQEARVASLSNNLQETVQQLAAANEAVRQQQAKVKALEAQVANQANRSASQQEDEAAKTQQVRTLQQELSQTKTQLAQARQAIIALESQLNRPLAIDTTNKAASMAVLTQELANVKAQQTTLKQQLKAAAAAEVSAQQATLKLGQANQTIVRLQQQLASVKPTVTPALSVANTGALTAQNKQLAVDLADARQTINLLSERLDNAPKAPLPTAPIAKPPTYVTVDTSLLSQARQAVAAQKPRTVLPQVVKAVASQPDNHELALVLAQLYSQTGQDDKVLATLRPILASSANRLTAIQRQEGQRLVGKAYLIQGNPTGAAQAYQAAIPVDVLTNLATALKKQNQLASAELVLKTALTVAPNDPQLYFNLGNLYSRMNQLDKARQQYRKALTLDPKLSPALYNLALLEVAANQPTVAKRYLQQYLNINPQSPDRQAIQALLLTL